MLPRRDPTASRTFSFAGAAANAGTNSMVPASSRAVRAAIIETIHSPTNPRLVGPLEDHTRQGRGPALLPLGAGVEFTPGERPLRILLVEDEPQAAEVLAKGLQE